MSKTVMIPSTQGNPFVCSVNNQKYSYEAGTEQTVPDEVAAIIDSADNFPPAAPDVDAPFNGGGGWPADLPKPSVGGYGYTEQGEQTVITWDGDTEGRDVFDNAYYKITDDAPQISTNFKKFIFNGVEHEITEENIEAGADHLIFIIVNDIIYVVIADEDVDLGGVSVTKGVYFVKAPVGGYVSSLTYGTPDTVHKIDERYLPSSGGGGAMVVVPISLNMETHEYEFTDDAIPTLDAFKSDFDSGKMYPISLLATAYLGGMPVVAASTITNINSAQGMFTMFAYAFGEGDSGLTANEYTIMNSGGEWSISMTNIGE